MKSEVERSIGCDGCIEMGHIAPGSINIDFNIHPTADGKKATDHLNEMYNQLADPTSPLRTGSLGHLMGDAKMTHSIIKKHDLPSEGDKLITAVNEALDGWEKRLDNSVNEVHGAMLNVNNEAEETAIVAEAFKHGEKAFHDYIGTKTSELNGLQSLAGFPQGPLPLPTVPPPPPAPPPPPEIAMSPGAAIPAAASGPGLMDRMNLSPLVVAAPAPPPLGPAPAAALLAGKVVTAVSVPASPWGHET